MHSSDNLLPIQSTNNDRPHRPRNAVGHYSLLVRESLTSRVFMIICTFFLFILLVLGLIAFILLLSLRPQQPRVHIEDFQLPPLTHPNSSAKAQVIFNVTLRNANSKVVVHYNSIRATVVYNLRTIGGTTLVPYSFHQEPKNTTALSGTLSKVVNSRRWIILAKHRSATKFAFRVKIISVIKFEVLGWDSKHYKLHANCEVVVGSDGLILASSKNKRCPVYFT